MKDEGLFWSVDGIHQMQATAEFLSSTCNPISVWNWSPFGFRTQGKLWVRTQGYFGKYFFDFKCLTFKDIAMVILMFCHQPALQFLFDIELFSYQALGTSIGAPISSLPQLNCLSMLFLCLVCVCVCVCVTETGSERERERDGKSGRIYVQ